MFVCVGAYVNEQSINVLIKNYTNWIYISSRIDKIVDVCWKILYFYPLRRRSLYTRDT